MSWVRKPSPFRGEPCGILRLLHESLFPVHFVAGFIFVWPPGLMNSRDAFFSFQSELIITLSAPDRLNPSLNMIPEAHWRRFRRGSRRERWSQKIKIKTYPGQSGLKYRKWLTIWKVLTPYPNYLNPQSWDALWEKGSECQMEWGRLEVWLGILRAGGRLPCLCWGSPTEGQVHLELFGSLLTAMRKQQIKSS